MVDNVLFITIGALYSEFLSISDFEIVRKYADVSYSQ